MRSDWLIESGQYPAEIRESDDQITLANGLISRTWCLKPNVATVAFDNLMTGESIIRSIRPEAVLELDGQRFTVGGLVGLEEHGYFRREWLDDLTSDPASFRFTGYETGSTVAPFDWKRVRPAPDGQWPPPGVRLTLHFAPPESLPNGPGVSVYYELYDGIPLISTWFTLTNSSETPIRLNTFISEQLAVVEYESEAEVVERWNTPRLHVESDYALEDIRTYQPRRTTHWMPDSEYTSQVNYLYENPCLLESRPPRGPNLLIPGGETFESFRTYELAYDSTERERRGLALRRMYRTIAPWSLENPILMHVRESADESVKLAIDQCAEVGFEMVILTFASGFDVEDESTENITRMRELADYAHGRGVELGGYSLLASRTIDEANDAINPETGRPGNAVFEESPCLCSEWGRDYFRKLYAFYEKTGFDLLEHDGPYPGDWCASTDHPDHEGLEDSQWRQWERSRDLYRWFRERGVYLNAPDWYFLCGSNKTAMGYRETNWSLPRDRQIILGRQNMYDGTWKKTPSMGWMFVPLVEYHGGGAAATLEPLSEHLDSYDAHLVQNFAYGAQACYRGPRLYDTDEVRNVVKKRVAFFKKHRAILESDTIHLGRPDSRDIDCVLHVNPTLDERAFLAVFNPLEEDVERTVSVPLYYSGITTDAEITGVDGVPVEYELDREYSIDLPVRVSAQGWTWFVIRDVD
jgi:hypothetical protein